MDQRKLLLSQWLKGFIGSSDYTLEPASEDASFRSYYRLKTPKKTFIVMDAPPAHEDCRPFLNVQEMLANGGVNVPQIHAFDKNNGFMLLSDLGDVLFLDVLNEDSASYFYSLAIDELLKIQAVEVSNELPMYDSQLLKNELELFEEWFIGKHLGFELNDGQRQVLQHLNEFLITNALNQPKVLVHRDYHSRNIMYFDEKPGIIDFQDAVFGPISYDLASLLKDCYIKWPDKTIAQFVALYLDKYNQQNNSQIQFDVFLKWFDLMAAQRHMKAIGIFCRLNYRDGKKKFLNDIPRTMSYLTETCEKYPELTDFAGVLSEIKPKISHA